MNRFFHDLLESVQQMDEVIKGETAPSPDSNVGAIQVKEIRKATGLTQSRFSEKIGIEVATLRNWEQSRCEPTGPVKALLMAIRNDPKHGLQARAQYHASSVE